MNWLISNKEPDGLWVPILDEETLASGAVADLVNQLPWYKRTPKIEVYLASHLLPIMRSGQARPYVQSQIERLDIPQEAAASFVRDLEERGCCHFGEGRCFHSPIAFAISQPNGVFGFNRYTNQRQFITPALYRCVEMLGVGMPCQEYESRLMDSLQSKELAEQVLNSLAAQGLLLCANTAQQSLADHGPLRWNIEFTCDDRLLDAAEWERRIAFLTDAFESHYFPLHGFFFTTPIRLVGNLDTVLRNGSPAYFWDLFFKLQGISEHIPIDLRFTGSGAGGRWRELTVNSPAVFDWRLTADLRQDGSRLVGDLGRFAEGQPRMRSPVTLLANGSLPAALGAIHDLARFRLYRENLASSVAVDSTAPVPGISCAAVLAACRPEGCVPTASPYIDGRGDVFSCSLEGGVPLGNIASGAQQVEARRRQVRNARGGACKFGVNPCDTAGGTADCERRPAVPEDLTRELLKESALHFTCP